MAFVSSLMVGTTIAGLAQSGIDTATNKKKEKKMKAIEVQASALESRAAATQSAIPNQNRFAAAALQSNADSDYRKASKLRNL